MCTSASQIVLEASIISFCLFDIFFFYQFAFWKDDVENSLCDTYHSEISILEPSVHMFFMFLFNIKHVYNVFEFND